MAFLTKKKLNWRNYSTLINSLFWIFLLNGAKGTPVRGPTRLLPSNEQRTLQVARLGQEFRLSCPVEGDPAPMVDWYKDGEPITSAWSRFFVRTNSITLRIRPAHAEDSGLYECKGVNGFGSQIARIRVIVVEDAFTVGAELKAGFLDNNGGAASRKRQDLTASIVTATNFPPEFSPETLEQATSPIHLSTGNTIRLRCDAKGSPNARVTWFKNGKPVGDKLWKWSTWTLVLTKLTAEDSGAYQCLASNSVGTVELTIQLHVAEMLEKKRPELASGYPNNMSVLAGNEAILECVVRSGFSTMPPHIKWLKRVPEEQATTDGNHRGMGINNRHSKYRLLPVENTHVLVIQETHDEGIRINETKRNGTFVSKLIISRTEAGDEGNYLCLATNSQGYTFKEARLTVLAGAEIISSTVAGIPLLLIVIGLSIPIVLLVIGSACFLRRYHDRIRKQAKSLSPRKSTSAPSLSSSSSTTFHQMSKQNYEQRQLLVSTASTHSHSSSSSGRGGDGSYLHHHCQPLTHKPPQHPVIEIAMSRCSCCGGGDQSSSEVSAPTGRPQPPPRHYEQCYNNSFVGSTSHSIHCGHWT